MEDVDGHSADENSIEVNEELEKKKIKQLKSYVWTYMKMIGKGKDGVERAECRGCKGVYQVGSTPGPNGKNYETSHLKRHIPKYKMRKYHDLGQMYMDQQGNIQSRKIDQMTSHEKLAEAIIEHDLPYSFVEYTKIRAWLDYINPKVIMPSRNTSVVDVQKVYFKEKEKLIRALAKIPNRVCLTSDCWTAGTSEGYLCLTTQYVDDNGKSVAKLLNFCRMVPPHTGVELAATIYDCLKKWGIDRKVLSITLDNATNNDSLQTILKGHLGLQKSLLCDVSDEVIKEIVARMFKKFQKYGNRFSVILSFGAILDPRFKTQLLEFCFSNVVASSAKESVATIEKKLHKLYEQYENNQARRVTTTTLQCKPDEEEANPNKKSPVYLLGV
ncbi:hypothetical protein P3S68_025847 [Capsicum galapagoense]